MPYEIEKQHYDHHGFVIVRKLLGDADFAVLQENLDRYVREVVPTLPDSDAFYQDRDRPETLKQLQRMGCDPFFLDYSRTLNGHCYPRRLSANRSQPINRNGLTSRPVQTTSRHRIKTTTISASLRRT